MEDEYKGYEDGREKSTSFLLTRSTSETIYSPKRTTDSAFDEENDNRNNIVQRYEENRKFNDETRITVQKSGEKADKDADALYNMMFYNDEDVESSSKKIESDQVENYDEKSKLHYSIDIDRSEYVKVTHTSEAAENTTVSKSITDLDDSSEDDINITYKSRLIPVLGAISDETSTSTISQDKVRGKRRPFCNLLKLRQLNFNSPRTLPEVSIKAHITFIYIFIGTMETSCSRNNRIFVDSGAAEAMGRK